MKMDADGKKEEKIKALEELEKNLENDAKISFLKKTLA